MNNKLIVGQRVFCIFCCEADSMDVRLDRKHGRPFLKCSRCSTTVFLGPWGWRGPTILWGRLEAAMRQENPAQVAEALMAREADRRDVADYVPNPAPH